MDKEEKILSETPTAEKRDEDTSSSTVFSAPVSHDDKKPTAKKSLKTIISVLLAVLLVAGVTVGVILLVPERNDDISSAFESYSVLSKDPSQIEKIVLENRGKETLVLTSAVEEKDGESSIVWSLEGYDNSLIDPTSLSYIASYATSVSAMKEYAIEDDDYGFENPQTVVTVYEKNGDSYTITIGNMSFDKSGYYVLLSTEPSKAYLSVEASITGFNVTAYDLAYSTVMSKIDTEKADSKYFTDNVLSTFDTIVLSGEKYGKTLSFKPNTDEELSAYATYISLLPQRRIADNVDELLNIFASGISTSSTVAFDTSDETLKKFGLDKPDVIAQINLGTKSYSAKFKLIEGTLNEYYVVADTDKTVRVCNSSSVTFLDKGETDFYSELMLLESLSDISSIKFSGEINSVFAVRYDEDNNEYTVTGQSGEIKASDFQTAYATLVATTVIDYATQDVNTSAALTLTISHTNESTPTVLSFKKSSETRYQYYIGDSPMGQITSSAYNMIVKSFKDF